MLYPHKRKQAKQNEEIKKHSADPLWASYRARMQNTCKTAIERVQNTTHASICFEFRFA